MHGPFLAIGAGFGFLGVAAGAFGAHALSAHLDAPALATFDTAVRYQMIHALALLVVATRAHLSQGKLLRRAGSAFAAGIVIFSGSLYILSLTGIAWLGAITPLGGLCFLAGWALLIVAGLRGKTG